MKRLLLILPLAACAPHVDPCLIRPLENHCHVEMDRSDHTAFVDHDTDHGVDGDDNGAGSASSDSMSDDSNGEGSD
jgi:hypothetical protein